MAAPAIKMLMACAGTSAPAWTPLYSDDFNRANNSSPGSPWVETFGNGIEINSNTLRGNATPSTAHYNASIGDDDMRVEVDIITQNSGNLAVDIRCNQASSHPTTYWRVYNENNGRVHILRNGSTEVGDSGTSAGVSLPYTQRIEVVGQQITVYQAGIQLLQITDNSGPSTGQYTGVRLDTTGDVIDAWRAGPP